MKSGSKRGAALAYVIIVTVVLMVLASALVSTAKFNIDYSKNSLESRQAYLTAKSAIEYGKAYLTKNPASDDFKVYATTDGAGFTTVVAKGTGNAVATYTKTTSTIDAKAKYKSSTDRFRSLGYKMTAGAGSVSVTNTDFMALGSYGTNDIVPNYVWPSFNGQTRSSDYPVLFNRNVHLQQGWGTSVLHTPSLYFMGNEQDWGNWDTAWSFDGDWWANMQLYTSFLYISHDFHSKPDSSFVPYSTQLIVYGKDMASSCFVYFKDDCKIYTNGGSKLQATIQSGLYIMKPGTNIFILNEKNKNNYLTQATAEQQKAYQKQIDNGNDIEDATNLFPGDNWILRNGLNWSSDGAFGINNYPNHIIYQKKIEKYSGITVGFPIQENYTPINNLKNEFIYWYLSDVSNWRNVLWGNGDPTQNNSFLNVSNVYTGEGINLKYVNDKADFIIPANKTVVFKADKITLSTEFKDSAVGDDDNRPHITHGGNAAQFILEAVDANAAVSLHVPNTLPVSYKNASGKIQNYSIKPGYYSVTQLNLLSDDAKTFFDATPPQSTPDGGTGSGSSGNVDVAGGVYTNG